MNYIFEQLAKKGRAEGIDDSIRQRDSRTWFRNAALAIQSVNKNKMMNDPGSLQKIITRKDIGKMFMFFYDPKHKATLPYYDIFPLIFPIEFYDDGFLGINLHYLPPILRAKLMDALYNTVSNRKYDETTKLTISYQILNSASRYRYFKPCVKRYLYSHVGSNYLNVIPRMWDAALMLPSSRFKKKSKENVWKDSVSKIG
jgi:hypothetical protein